MTLKFVLTAGAMFAAASLSPAQAQQDAASYPTKPVRVIVGSTTGGTADTVARVVSEKLTAKLGRPFLVENMPGANGVIATNYVAKAPPDGYVIQFGFISTLSITPHLTKNIAFDPIKDFAPISLVSYSPNLLLAHPGFGVKTVSDLIAKLKSTPGKLNYGSGGVGGSQHLSTEIFMQATATQAVHVPYRGSGALLASLMAGEIPFAFDTMTTAVPQVEAGTLVALAISSKARSPLMPNVPTVAETIPGFDVTAWNGFLAPARTPAAIVNKLSAAAAEYLKSREAQEFFAKLGTTAVGSTPAEFAALIEKDLRDFGKVIETAKITLE